MHDVNAQGNYIRFSPLELPDSARVRIDRLYPKTVVKTAVNSILVPRPTTATIGGQPLRDEAVLDWAGRVIDDIVPKKSA